MSLSSESGLSHKQESEDALRMGKKKYQMTKANEVAARLSIISGYFYIRHI